MCISLVGTWMQNIAQPWLAYTLTKSPFLLSIVGSAFNLARIAGPALAGILMGYLGISFCFFANAFSFAAVVISLFFIKPLTVEDKRKTKEGVISQIKDGLKYIYRHDILWDTLLVMTIIVTFTMSYNVLIPVFTKEVLKQNEAVFGMLMALMGVGSFVGAMIIATMSKSGPQKLILYIAPVIMSVLLIMIGYAGNYLLTGLLLALTGLAFVIYSSTTNSIMQLHTLDQYRGRVMSIYNLAFIGATPLGNLYAGIIMDRFGPRSGFLACGVTSLGLLVLLYIYQIGWKRRKQVSETKGNNVLP